MRLFRSKKVTSTGGTKLKIKNLNCSVSSSRKDVAVDVTGKAGYWVTYTLALLQQAKLDVDVKRVLNKTFMIVGNDPQALETIRANLVLLQNGICTPAG